ncbi:MAG: translation elongation factor 4 [Coriobacteriales bacterium]|nr:translation elongation factor 4 [Coriobacteriales bacterium]
MVDASKIRNFCIIAHIDHGKSTIADRILQMTHTIADRDMKEQILDSMDIERERGITIKSQAVTLKYKAKDCQEYLFNLIDTPGHVDFTYEVSRSLAACEGAILVVDATQGVEAQTVANALLAMNANLEIIVAINKIDLGAAEVERVKGEIEEGLAIPADDAILTSAKTGIGIEELLEAVVNRVPAPKSKTNAPLKALIFDSYFDSFRGVIALIKVVEGVLNPKDKILFMQAQTSCEAEEIGVNRPDRTPVDELIAGQVGYLITGLKDPKDVKVGDTATLAKNGADKALEGYREVKPMVYVGIFPIDADQYPLLRDALDKLSLNDPALVYNPETSHALGFGFRVGFLGLLHMEVIKERLEREFNLDLIATAPSVEYHVYLTNKEMLEVHSPQDMPDEARIDHIEEPYLKTSIIVPSEYVGPVMELSTSRRGTFKNMQYLSQNTVELHFDLPLSELIMDFFDALKSRTKGYASLDYELDDYRTNDLVKLEVLLSGKVVDALCFIVHKDNAYHVGHELTVKLKEIIPRQLFEVPIQAAIGSRVLARTNVKAKRKDVLAKCYGGDVTRKRKLLEKQKAGKKRMKAIGNVEVPQEAFMAILEVGNSEN